MNLDNTKNSTGQTANESEETNTSAINRLKRKISAKTSARCTAGFLALSYCLYNYGFKTFTAPLGVVYNAGRFVLGFSNNSEENNEEEALDCSVLEQRVRTTQKKGFYEFSSDGEEKEYYFTYNERDSITELLIEDKAGGINYRLVDSNDAKNLSNYKYLWPDELTLDKLVINGGGEAERTFNRKYIEGLDPSDANRKLFVNMQKIFRQIYNYLGREKVGK